MNLTHLTYAEAAERLRIPERTVRQYATERKLERVKIGRHAFVTVASVERFLASCIERPLRAVPDVGSFAELGATIREGRA